MAALPDSPLGSTSHSTSKRRAPLSLYIPGTSFRNLQPCNDSLPDQPLVLPSHGTSDVCGLKIEAAASDRYCPRPARITYRRRRRTVCCESGR